MLVHNLFFKILENNRIANIEEESENLNCFMIEKVCKITVCKVLS